MDRPEQHEIDTQARVIFEGKLPKGILFRQQPQYDYGIDGELEVFDNGKSTGNIFKVQLKGSKAPDYLKTSPEISFSIEVQNAQYLFNQIDIPTVLVLTDVSKSVVYWAPIQSNRHLKDQLDSATESGQKTVTVRIPLKNTIPETLPDFFTEMGNIRMLLALRISGSAKEDIFQQHLGDLDDKGIESEFEKLKQKTELTLLEKIERTIQKGAFEEADAMLLDIQKGDGYSPNLKLQAIITAESIELRPGVQVDRPAFYAWQASEMGKLKDKLDDQNQKIVESYAVFAEMSYLIFQDENLFLNWRITKEKEKNGTELFEPLWLASLPLERSKIVKRIVDCLERFTKLMIELLDKKYYSLVPLTGIRFFFFFLSFPRRLRQEGLNEAANHYDNWIDQSVMMIVSLLDRFKDREMADDRYGRCAHLYLIMALGDETKKETWNKKAEEIFEKIKNTKILKHWRDKAKPLMDMKVEAMSADKPDWEYIKKVYVDQARTLGIRLELLAGPPPKPGEDDMDYRIAELIAIGIEDLDPTRFVRGCTSFVFELTGPRGIPSAMMNLPTAGGKSVGCLKHPEHGMIGGLALGTIVSLFEQRYCSKCTDKTPHPSDWVANETWLIKQQEAYDKVRKFPKSQW